MSTKINFHYEAEQSFCGASRETQEAAVPVLEALSSGFQVTWFRESGRLLWNALVKANPNIRDQFGLQRECFVIGNGFPSDFQQRTLNQELPQNLVDRIDPAVRFVASIVPTADAFCAAWAQKNKKTVVVIKPPYRIGAEDGDYVFRLLSSSLWRRDYFAEAEPVRDPSEFFGREIVVSELLSKILLGKPVSIFGLRKIGKSSLLGRLEDLVTQDDSAIGATAFLIGNATRLKTGRWWDLANDLIRAWELSLRRIAESMGSRVRPKAGRLVETIERRCGTESVLAAAFEKDVLALLKSARALQIEAGRDHVRLVMFLDECDHLYPHLSDAGYWRSDFFGFWNQLQAIKRGLEDPAEIVFVLSGVNPSGIEQGVLVGRPNPLYELQRTYLGPMSEQEAGAMMVGLGSRMGLIFEAAALAESYSLVGGHPLLLRRLGSAIHETHLDRTSMLNVAKRSVRQAYERRKRDLYNQVVWILEYLGQVAPDEERMLRDIATGGALAYQEFWGDNDFRETYAYHLERYGLVRFADETPTVELALIKEALKRPVVSGFVEQKTELKDVVDSLETLIRIRLRVDLERGRTETEAIRAVTGAIPKEGSNRALDRDELVRLGDIAGVGAVLESLNWGDYAILLEKYHDEISWAGPPLERADRISGLRAGFETAHVVRHNNDHKLQEAIDAKGFADLLGQFSRLRDMVSE